MNIFGLDSPKKHVYQTPAFFLVIFVFLYIVLFLLNHENSWMHPENFQIKRAVLSNGTSLVWPDDLKRCLDYMTFESQHRIYRPLSHLFEIIDTKFRVLLWKWIVPHPTLSLRFIFGLFLSPWLLYLLLCNLKLSREFALGGVALYLSSPGFLCNLTMNARPSKLMMNFSILLCLFLASRIMSSILAHEEKGQKNNHIFGFFFLCAVMFVSFFWDETALLIYPSVLIFYPRLIFNKWRAPLFILLPFLVYYFDFYFLPKLSVLAGYGWPRPNAFPAFETIFSVPSDFLSSFFLNTKTLFRESLGLSGFFTERTPLGKALLILNWSGLLVLSVYFIKQVIGCLFQREKERSRSHCFLFLAVLFCYLMFVAFFYTYLLLKAPLKIWGIYWHGTYWSIFFTILFVQIIQTAKLPRFVSLMIFTVLTLNLLYVYPYTNYAYKKFHFYFPNHAVDFQKIFTGEINRFSIPHDTPADLYKITRDYWLESKNPSADFSEKKLPKELLYLPIELRTGKNKLYPVETEAIPDAWTVADDY